MRLRSTERSEDAAIPFPLIDGEGAANGEAAHAMPVDPLIVALGNPDDLLAIQARDIQSTLAALRLPDGGAPSSIAVLTVGAVDEAAILTANIAVSAALSGIRTLLVDMGQSGFIQHRLLGNAPEPASAEEEDDLFGFIRPTAIRKLSLLAAPLPEMRAQDHVAPLADRLSDMSTHFDMCLVDASHVEDLALAAASAQVAILAVSRDATTTANLKSTINKLAMLGTPLMGTVMFV